MKIKVRLIGDATGISGYAAHTRLILRALKTWGFESRIDFELFNRPKDQTRAELSELEARDYVRWAQNKHSKPDIVIYLEPAQFYAFQPGVKTIGFFHWETTRISTTPRNGKANLNIAAQLNRCDAVITSAESAANAYKSSGVTVPIHVVRGPIFNHTTQNELQINDITVVNGNPVWRDERLPVIGYMAQWTPRKNIRGFIEDVTCAFSGGEAIMLLKTYGTGKPGENERIVQECRAIRDAVNRPDAPQIIVLTNSLTDEQVYEWFNSVDIYYAPSHCEGLGLPVTFAAAAGCFPIVPSWGGPSEFLPPECQVDGHFEPAIGMSAYEFDQYWFQVDRREAIRKLRAARELLLDKPRLNLARANIHDTYVKAAGWQQTAQGLLDVIRQVHEAPARSAV